jgi:hypothetical protein
MQPATPPAALLLVEHCTAIFGHLDRRSVFDATLVCRAWAVCSTRWLWRAPPFAELLHLQRARRDAYLPALRCLELPRLPHNGVGPGGEGSGYCSLAAGNNDGRTEVGAAAAATTASSPLSTADRASADAGAWVLRHGRFDALRTVELDMLALYSASELPCALAVLAHSGVSITTAAIRLWSIEVYQQKLVMHLAAVDEDCCANPAAVVVDESMLAALRALGALPRQSTLLVEVPSRASLFRSLSADNKTATAAVAGGGGGGGGGGAGGWVSSGGGALPSSWPARVACLPDRGARTCGVSAWRQRRGTRPCRHVDGRALHARADAFAPSLASAAHPFRSQIRH